MTERIRKVEGMEAVDGVGKHVLQKYVRNI